MTVTSQLAHQAITIFQRYIALFECKPAVHFELEGCCITPKGQQLNQTHFSRINQQLAKLGIEAELVDEYWHNQWEYVSTFSGQTPLKEAQNLDKALQILPELFRQLGISQTLIKPVIWAGDKGQLALGSKNIFTSGERAVHIPNAIQLNVSVTNQQGENLVADPTFGELLQSCFIKTSLACCLLYMPELDAFERLALKTKYGLADELCSPTEISGGHQGSIALYTTQGKHNQPMGLKTLVIDQHQQALVSEQQWQKTARIEHRLGAASTHYNPYVNVAYALANVADALDIFYHQGKGNCTNYLVKRDYNQQLPTKLTGDESGFDAVTLFKQDQWFAKRITKSAKKLQLDKATTELGSTLQRNILAKYQVNTDIQIVSAG